MQNSNEYHFSIPSEHPCYADHFPNDPIVPGALLLDWVLRELKQYAPHSRVSGFRTVKFVHRVKPSDDCRLLMQESTSTSQIKIKLFCNDTLVLKATVDTQEQA